MPFPWGIRSVAANDDDVIPNRIRVSERSDRGARFDVGLREYPRIKVVVPVGRECPRHIHPAALYGRLRLRVFVAGHERQDQCNGDEQKHRPDNFLHDVYSLLRKKGRSNCPYPSSRSMIDVCLGSINPVISAIEHILRAASREGSAGSVQYKGRGGGRGEYSPQMACRIRIALRDKRNARHEVSVW